MTTQEYVTIIIFIIAITVNCLTVYSQKKYRIYDIFGSKAHSVHSAVLSLVWGVFIVSYALLELTASTANDNNSYAPAGYVLKVLAVILFSLSLKQIGSGALTNKDLFTGEKRKLHGVYCYISEPIYVSYTLFILSSGLVTGIEAFYYMAVVSLIGLQIIESKIESIK